MHEALIAADEIYNITLQIMNSHQVDAKLVPLIMGSVTQRLECFAIGAMARELEKPEETEVENG